MALATGDGVTDVRYPCPENGGGSERCCPRKAIYEVKYLSKKTHANAVSLLGTAGTVFCLNNFISSPRTKIFAKLNQSPCIAQETYLIYCKIQDEILSSQVKYISIINNLENDEISIFWLCNKQPIKVAVKKKIQKTKNCHILQWYSWKKNKK